MRYRSFAAILLITAAVLATRAAWADYRALPLPRLVSDAEIIARVKVVAAGPTSRVDPEEEAGKRPGFPLPCLAQVRVLESFKGAGMETELSISYDPSRICPGVRYATGEECVVFLVRGKDGLLKTLNWDTGKKPIRKPAEAAEWAGKIRNLLKRTPASDERAVR